MKKNYLEPMHKKRCIEQNKTYYRAKVNVKDILVIGFVFFVVWRLLDKHREKCYTERAKSIKYCNVYDADLFFRGIQL